MPDDARSELYKFIRDRYDKLVVARTMSQTRLGQLLVVVGFLIAATVATGIPQLCLAFEQERSVAARVVAYSAAAGLAVTLGLLGWLIYELIQGLSHFEFAIPEAKRESLLKCMESDQMTADYVQKVLVEHYVAASDENAKQGGFVGKRIRRSLRLVVASLIAGIIFLALLVAARMTGETVTPNNVEKESTSMPDESQSGGSGQDQSTTPASTPAETVDSPPPELDMGIQHVTGGYQPPGIKIVGVPKNEK